LDVPHLRKGFHPFARRCSGCYYDESPSAYPIYYHLNLSLEKAFYVVFHYCRKKAISSYALAMEIGVSQPTAEELQTG